MNSINISEAVKLGIHSLVIMAMNPERKWKTGEVAEELKASPHHLAKIHTRLVNAGIISSTRGPRGGLTLARDAEEITLYHIYREIEGEPIPSHCMFNKPICSRKSCIFSNLFIDINNQILTYFKNTSLQNLVDVESE